MELDTRSPKRVKLDHAEEEAIFDDPSLQRRASEVCSSGSAGNGFLSGRVFMSWAPTASMTLRFLMETEETNDYGATHKQKFAVVFTGACSDFLGDLALHARDEISLSLKGARIELADRPLQSCTLAMKLVYENGVIIMFTKRASGSDSGKITNTWKLSQNWFDSPAPEEIPRSVSPPEGSVKITKKEERRRKKARRDQTKPESIAQADPDLPDVLDEGMAVPSVVSISDFPEAPPAPNVAQGSAVEMKAGFQTDSHKYYSIGEVSSGQIVDLIGVVVHATLPTQTRTGDWSVNIKVVDPSSPTKAGSNDLEAFGINCFTRQHISGLPQPDAGEVLMLRRIQICDMKGHLKGTAHHNRFQWAIFSPGQKRMHHGESNVGLKHKGQADTAIFWTPFIDAEPSEVDYCARLSEWWLRREKMSRGTSDETHPIVTSLSTYEKMGGAKRMHRLIKDAGPNVAPNGYFDCTVEVLHGFMNSNEVFSLYVTDYTRNDLMTPVQADWCSPELSDCVLKMEMWDAASKIGPSMEPGTYYAMSNVRMRLSRGGYLEAKMVLPKITRLNEEDASRIPRLKELLDRKVKWNNQNGGPCTIEDKLIEEVVEDQFFNCLVEVLHVTNSGYGPPYIYATDYTEHPYLQESKFEGEGWYKGLEGRVVKISLWDCHTSIANSITPGFYYSIKKLRLRLSPRGDRFEGELRGRERLINQLNQRSRDGSLQQLLRRKQRALHPSQEPQQVSYDSTREHKPSTSSAVTSPDQRDKHSKSPRDLSRIPTPDPLAHEAHPKTPSKHKVAMQQYISFKEMVANTTCPNKFLVRARAVDFYPLNLKDCSKQFCTRCKTDVPAKYKACIECGDTEYEYVTHRYQLFLMLEDDDGMRLVVSIYDKSHLFDGLQRANFKDNPVAYGNFNDRLSQLLGNLAEVHERGLCGEKIAPETKIHELEVVSWDTSNSKRAYGLYRCRSYDHSML